MTRPAGCDDGDCDFYLRQRVSTFREHPVEATDGKGLVAAYLENEAHDEDVEVLDQWLYCNECGLKPAEQVVEIEWL